MRRIPLRFLLGLVLTTQASVASAEWFPNGTPLCTEPHGQDLAAATSDGAGGAIVVFGDHREAEPSGALYAQRVLVNGSIAPGWPVDGRPVCSAGHAEYATAVPDGAGGALIFWDTTDLFAQHLTASGDVAPGWSACGLPVCVAPLVQYAAAAIPDGAGGAFVTWQDNRTDASDLYVQHMNSTGALAWTPSGVPVCTAPGLQAAPKLISDGGSGIFITWEDSRSGAPHVYAQHVDGSGAIVAGWPANGVAVGRPGDDEYAPAIAGDATGGVYIAWSTGQSGVVFHPYVQRLTASGAVMPGWPAGGIATCSLLQSQTIPRLVEDGAGGIYVAWQDWRDFTNPELNVDLYVQHVMASGTFVPGWTVNGNPLCTAPHVQDFLGTTTDHAGGLLAAWEDRRNGSDFDIYAVRLDPGGHVAIGWISDGLPLCTTTGDQQFPLIVPSTNGGAIVAWTDERTGLGVTHRDIYAARTLDDAIVPTQLAPASAEVVNGVVRLVWQSDGTASLLATVERRTESSAWSAVGNAASDGGGRLAFEDRNAVAGTRYGYRLVLGGGVTWASSESWVDVPGLLALALAVPSPNPADGAFAFGITLPVASPATLQLFDLSGRRLFSRDVGALGAGPHVIRIPTLELTPGVYLARLTQGGRAVVVRASVVK
jgi:hypothetical protein